MFACKEVYGNIEFSDIDKIKIIAFCQKHPDKDMALKLKKEGDHYIIASSRASKDDGEVFAQEVLQVLKKQESRWFQDIETFMIDRELFLVYLSQLLFDIPALINKFETIYQENSLGQHRTNGKIHRIAVVAERTLWITSELLFAKAH